MLNQRNSSSHIYDKEAANNLVDKIISEYIPTFVDLEERLEERYKDIIGTI